MQHKQIDWEVKKNQLTRPTPFFRTLTKEHMMRAQRELKHTPRFVLKRDALVQEMPLFSAYLDELKIHPIIHHIPNIRLRGDSGSHHWPQWIYQVNDLKFTFTWSMGVHYMYLEKYNGTGIFLDCYQREDNFTTFVWEQPAPQVNREMVMASYVGDALYIVDQTLDDFAEEMGITKPSKAIQVYHNCQQARTNLIRYGMNIDKAWELLQEDGY